jgi:AraC family transcriptional regulator of adaptative response / DNA-3-methyladenine glycosylase II
VSRAFALIDRGALDEGRVSDLAARLGMGPRHLNRLFLRYVGASPIAAGRTRRVQLAKTLLTETAMPIADVAFAAGFQSVRRFNAVFRGTYGRPPSAVRRLLDETSVGGGPITLRLAYRPPFCWRNMVRLLGAEHTPGVEEVDRLGYRRTVMLDGRIGWFSVRPVTSAHQLELRLWLPDYVRLRTAVERVRLMFDLDADPQRIARQLAPDTALAPLLRRVKGLRLPGAWDGFEIAVGRLVLRDVGRSRAGRVLGALANACGRRLDPRPEGGPYILFPEAGVLAASTSSQVGLSRRGARDLRRLARATASGAIQFDGRASFDELVGQLTRVGAFDVPTAHWIAMRSLAEPDAAPFRSARGREERRWRPWRSYVAVLRASARLAPTNAQGVKA